MKIIKKYLFLFGVILAAVSAVGRVLIDTKKTEIVVYYGIAEFRSFRTIANVCLVLGIIAAVIGFAVTVK